MSSQKRPYHQNIEDVNTSHDFGKRTVYMTVRKHSNYLQALSYQASTSPSGFLSGQFWFHYEHISSREASVADPYKVAAEQYELVTDYREKG